MAREIRPRGQPRRSLPNTTMGRKLNDNRDAIRAIVTAHGGRDPRVFGSIARGDDDRESDVDLLVDLPRRSGVFMIGVIAREVEGILDVDVDVVPQAALRPELRERILSEAIDL